MIKDLDAAMLKKIVPMQRLGQPSEVAELVHFLAGDNAAYITGQVITISGGLG
jgi:3-oxoacyl-[acyl-carrier protein] reductase